MGSAKKPADGGDELPEDLGSVTPAYRRALWIVALLNLGYAVAEVAASIKGSSEALKADALDFFGDGVITGLGLLAINWRSGARAKAALAQGLFLALLGLGVLATAIYRVFVVNEPVAETMGIFGAMALVVNVVAALVLRPHRKGDANARAVWLFSRNDALGNLAVLLAAGVVVWTGTRWPDLVAATLVAGLFIQSAWRIVADAKRDLRASAA